MPGPPPPLSVAETPAHKNEKIEEKLPILVDHSQSFLANYTFKQKADYRKLYLMAEFHKQNSLLPSDIWIQQQQVSYTA